MDMDDDHVIGVKNVTMNEAYFVGHFPEEPVMPGVLQIEAMAQTGGIFSLKKYKDPENYITYFLKIDNVKFRNKVVPGDTLVFSLELVSPIRRGLCHMRGTGYVANKPVIEGEMLAQISKKTT
jgi:UDP-3-O-[3-hydroxymyristoyl] N-acetylglucosamine deacetylase/3-hydroxyacyl-[acyl-carrier-protein] dehydratase